MTSGWRGGVLAPCARRWMAALVLPLLVLWVIATWWLDRWSLGLAFSAYATPVRMLANAAVGLTVFLLLSALTRRLLFSLLLTSGLQAAVYAASAVKYRLLGLPLMLQDAHFLTSLDSASLHLFSSYVDIGWQQIGIAVATMVLLLGWFWVEPRWCKSLSRMRGFIVVVATLLLLSLKLAIWPWASAWYDQAHIRSSPLSTNNAALHGGLVSSMVYYHARQQHRAFNVDAAALAATLQSAPVRSQMESAAAIRATATKPDVIVILSESFMDPRVLQGMQDLPDLIPNMRAAIAAQQGGMMLAPTFGGGTVRTEFEVLTGMPVTAFQDAYYPYVNLNRAFMPGLVSALERKGYASVAVHGNAGSFWNRASTYKAMGIDRFLTQDAMVDRGARHDGGWISDQSMTDLLLDELNKAKRPTVAVAISIESHGPYSRQTGLLDPAEWSAIQLPQGLDAKAATEFRTYLYHLRHADRELGRLLAGLKARGRPFVLLFFGDHLPAFDGVYEQLGFVDGRDAAQQYVPWLLASADGRAHSPAFAQAWELPGLLMQMAAADDDDWFGFVRGVGVCLRSAEPQAKAACTDGLNAGANARLMGTFDRYVKP